MFEYESDEDNDNAEEKQEEANTAQEQVINQNNK